MKIILFSCLLTVSLFVKAQWQNIQTFPNVAYSLITCNNNLFAGLGGGGVYTSQDSGSTWVAANNGIQMGGAYVFSLASRNDSIYAGGFGEVCFSNDYGANWTLLNLNLWLNNNVYALIIKDDYLFAGVGHDNSNGVYRKQLNGSGWTQMNNGLPVNVSVNAFATNNNSLIAGTDLGVYISTNNGLNWTTSNNGISASLSIKSLYVINGNLLAGTTNGIYYSSDNGNNWIFSNGLPPNSYITCFTSYNDRVLSGTLESAYYSTDNGINWTKINTGLDSVLSFYSMTSFGEYVYAGTGQGISTSNSVFKLSYNAFSISDNNNSKYEDFYIYPNPSHENTTIKLCSEIRNAELSIFNNSGKKIKTFKNITNQSIILYRGNLQNGIYLIRLTKEQNTLSTKKLIITGN